MSETLKKHDPARCMKCGFCMSVCPVYKEDLLEGHVARGRNMLINTNENDGRIGVDRYKKELSYCMLCTRCSAVCPAGLTPDVITLNAKNRLLEKNGPTRSQKWVNQALLNNRSALAKMIGASAALPTIASGGKKPLRHMADMARIFSKSVSFPTLSMPSLKHRVKGIIKPTGSIKTKGRVAVFPGCVFEFFQARIGAEMINSIAAIGYEVVYVKNLSCCGQAVYNGGDFETAKQLAQKNIELLSKYDTIITGCATCGSAMTSYGEWFADDKEWRGRAETVAGRITEYSVFMNSELSAKETSNLDISDINSVTYHDPCHLRQHQGVFAEPREILKSLPGINYIEMPNADACCGLGGSFALTHKDISSAIQDKKINAIKSTNADAVVTSCPGCLMYLNHGVKQHKLPVKVLHIAELVQSVQQKKGG